MAQPQLRYSRIPELWATLGWFMLLTGCTTPIDTAQRNFQLLPPDVLERSATILLKLGSNQGDASHHWEEVLNVDAERIYLVILGPLGQRLANLSFDGQQLTVDRGGPIPINMPLEKLLGELQMIFWPLAVLNTGEGNRDWYFEEQTHIRYVYYQNQLMAEIRRHSSSPWSGNFDYISRISDYRLSVRSSQLDPS